MLFEFPYSRQQPGVDAVEEGYYLLRREGRVDVPIRIWFGWPLDPETNELLERSPRWMVEINGDLAGDPDAPARIDGRPIESLVGIWPECRRWPTDRADYEYRVDRARFAQQHDPSDPFADAGRVDPMTAPLPFLDC